MKEKINQIANDIFEYELPKLLVRPEKLQLLVEAGSVYRGEFHITNDINQEMKGTVCTESEVLVMEEEDFCGAEQVVRFSVCAQYLEAGERIETKLQLLSNCGNKIIPVLIEIVPATAETSMGKIRDLKQFADLARNNMPEAVFLFAKPEFEKIFLDGKTDDIELYRGLMMGKDIGVAMEEFLVAAHKKVPMHLSVNKTEHYVKAGKVPFQELIHIQKNTWGYCEYGIEVDADFLNVSRKVLRGYDFNGEICELPVEILPEKMEAEEACGHIRIFNIHQSISVKIRISKENIAESYAERLQKRKENINQLLDIFLKFHDHRCNKKVYSQTVERIVCSLDVLSQEKSSDDWLVHCFRIHLAMINQLEETVVMEMAHIEKNLEELREKQPEYYCAYYYLRYLWKQEEKNSQNAYLKIQDVYRVNRQNWIVLWFLIQTGGTMWSSVKREEEILYHLNLNCTNPLLYYELCSLYNEKPDMLNELQDVQFASLHWGCGEEILNADTEYRYAYLISRKHIRYSEEYLQDLCHIYKKKPSDDILRMICQMLIRGNRTAPEAGEWYELGIQKNLRLTELYEYYMYSLPVGKNIVLPEKVLLYFRYNNHLNASKKAMLYAYIIQNKQQDRQMYEDYFPVMAEFARQELAVGKISSSLAVIYEEILREGAMDDRILANLPKVLFAREISCPNSDIIKVVVRHGELSKEMSAPLIYGKAVLPLYTRNAQIFLVDRQGNRYSKTIDYMVEKLMHVDHMAAKCLPFRKEDAGLLLYLYQKADAAGREKEEVVELQKRIMQLEAFSVEFYQKIYQMQLVHYYENFSGELLDYYLQNLDWNFVGKKEMHLFVDYCAVRHCYKKGMEGIHKFGFSGIDAKKLLLISAETYGSHCCQEDDFLVKMAWYIFRHGEFDENMLQYLCDYFSGNVAEMAEIWKAAEGFGMDTIEYSERILAQVLFTGEMCDEMYEIFYEYQKKGIRHKLVRSFLKMLAYENVVKGRYLPEKIYEYFFREVQLGENRACQLSLLKYLSEKNTLTEEELVFADYNLHELCKKNQILPFYQKFQGNIVLPDKIQKEQYIQYIASPESDVRLKYWIITNGKEKEPQYLRMQDVYEGIRVCGFILFEDESLKYQILEKKRNNERIESPIKTLSYKECVCSGESESDCSRINKILQCHKAGEEEKTVELLLQYYEKKEVAKILIKPIS